MKMESNDKVIMVTGANSGIGKVTALECAKTGAKIVLLCRNPVYGESAKNEIINASGNTHVDLIIADLSLLSSIRSAADNFKAKYGRLDVLVNNAGAVFEKRMLNAEGIELTFATNHLGYFRLTLMLLDLLKKSAPSRIVNVSSEAHRFFPGDPDDFQSSSKYSSFGAYGKSKCANILFTRELAARLKGTGVTVNCLHPGFVKTNFGHNNENRKQSFVMKAATSLLAISPEKGAETSVYLATSQDVENVTGEYFSKKKIAKPSRIASDPELARRLWEQSEKLSSL
jgi:NAD(P)-dependent dehydrogenase (short-subunit alcohol dehydrogenase family)